MGGLMYNSGTGPCILNTEYTEYTDSIDTETFQPRL